MKKIISLLCLFLLMTGCSGSAKTTRVSIKGIKEIQYSELQKLLKENKEFLLYIGRPDCGDCQEFEPILKEYLDKHSDEGVYYLNIKKYRAAAKKTNATQQDKDFYTNLSKELKFNWTPTIEIITNGKVGKQYTYLDEDYYEIKDRQKQIKRRQEFIDEFKKFMQEYYKEEG